MNNLFGPKTFVWWEIFLIKISLLSMGAAAGAYWHEFVLPYAGWLAIVGIAVGLYVAGKKLTEKS